MTRPRAAAAEFGNASEQLQPRQAQQPSTAQIRESPEFEQLRRRTVGFIAPVGFAFFAWYMAYAVLSAYARDWMGQTVFGSVNAGMLLGLAQFASTALITAAYVVHQRRLQPLERAAAEEVRR